MRVPYSIPGQSAFEKFNGVLFKKHRNAFNSKGAFKINRVRSNIKGRIQNESILRWQRERPVKNRLILNPFIKLWDRTRLTF